MKTLTPLLLLLPPLASDASTRPPKFTFDYAKPPAFRWGGALALAARGRSWDETWGDIFAYHNRTLFDYVPPSVYGRLGSALRGYFPDRAKELGGISAQFSEMYPDRTVSYEYLAAWAYYHELAHTDVADSASASSDEKSCTGLLAADSSGRVHHVANMDQSPRAVRNVTLQVDFVNSAVSDDVLYRGVDWYWYTTGTSRMVMPGLVTIQENWRHGPPLSLDDVLYEIESGVPPQIFVFRGALESAVRDPTVGFDDLVRSMSTTRLAAPYYVVMAGPGEMEGAVIARDGAGVASPGGKVLRLGEDDGSPTADPTLTPWAIVQTNYDHWEGDDVRDPRRTAAELALANFGRDEAATALGLFAVSSAYPVHNPTTAYTAVFDSRSGELHAFVRVGMCPEEGGSSIVDERYCRDDGAARRGFGAAAAGGAPEGPSSFRKTTRYAADVPIWAYAIMGVLGLALLVAIGLFFIFKTNTGVRGSVWSQYESVP